MNLMARCDRRLGRLVLFAACLCGLAHAEPRSTATRGARKAAAPPALPARSDSPARKEAGKEGSPPPQAAAAPASEKGVAGGAKAEGAGNVVSTEEGKEGVKTYKFGAVEVEGRLRSPQLIYFLRRVRAEFVAGDLGHRSFLPELKDTGRQSTFR